MKDQVFDLDLIQQTYQNLTHKVAAARSVLQRPLTLSEKILYSVIYGMANATTAYTRGKDYVDFAPDRIACQDATAQMALLQFMQAGKSRKSQSRPRYIAITLIQAKHWVPHPDLQNAQMMSVQRGI